MEHWRFYSTINKTKNYITHVALSSLYSQYNHRAEGGQGLTNDVSEGPWILDYTITPHPWFTCLPNSCGQAHCCSPVTYAVSHPNDQGLIRLFSLSIECLSVGSVYSCCIWILLCDSVLNIKTFIVLHQGFLFVSVHTHKIWDKKMLYIPLCCFLHLKSVEINDQIT